MTNSDMQALISKIMKDDETQQQLQSTFGEETVFDKSFTDGTQWKLSESYVLGKEEWNLLTATFNPDVGDIRSVFNEPLRDKIVQRPRYAMKCLRFNFEPPQDSTKEPIWITFFTTPDQKDLIGWMLSTM